MVMGVAGGGLPLEDERERILLLRERGFGGGSGKFGGRLKLLGEVGGGVGAEKALARRGKGSAQYFL
jgi:hypothetical protein